MSWNKRCHDKCAQGQTPREFETGAHKLSCPCGGGRLLRHNLFLSVLAEWFEAAYKVKLDREHVQVHLSGGERVDGVLPRPYDSERDLAVDVTVVCGDCQTYETLAHAQSATLLTDAAEKAKAAKHAAECRRNGLDYLTVAVTTYGGLGDEFLKKYFEPHYKRERALAKALGEPEWEVTRDKQRWLERFAAAIARGNRVMVDAARPRSSAAARGMRA